MIIEIFGKQLCGHCTRAKTALEIKEIPFEYKDFFDDLDEEEQAKVRERAPTAGSFPIIFIDNVYIGGADQLVSILK